MGTNNHPVSPSLLSAAGMTAVAVAAGHAHTCALLTGGGLVCCGDNSYGQLGINSTAQQSSMVSVSIGAGDLPYMNSMEQ